MLENIIQIIFWVFFIYGICCAIYDFIYFKKIKRIHQNINFILTVKNAENNIEEYMRNLIREQNIGNNITVIDTGSSDNTFSILQKLEKERYNMKVLNKNDGERYFHQLIDN